MLYSILITVQILIAVGLIALILLQQGKGADAGAAFGSGASQTVFGARGAGSFLTRLTAVFAVLFLTNSLVLAYITSHSIGAGRPSLLEETTAPSTTISVDDLIDQEGGGAVTPADVAEESGMQDVIDKLSEELPEGTSFQVTAPEGAPVDEALVAPPDDLPPVQE